MRRGIVLALATFAGLGCGSETGKEDVAAAATCDVAVSRFKELSIVDESVIEDARTHNATAGTWSFRHLVQELTPEGVQPEAFIAEWLNSWSSPRQVNGFRVEQRLAGHQAVICPWLRSTPENNCDASCDTCTAQKLDLAKAPFKLIAIVNRSDLTEMYDDSAGEGRFVFAATSGPGDEAASRHCGSVVDTGCTLDFTVILEYALPNRNGQDANTWAQRFHALGRFESFDDAYKAELEAITNAMTSRGVAPWRPHGSALSQVRTNERVFEWNWELREFKQPEAGSTVLAVTGTENTPDPSINGSEALKRWLLDNKAKVLSERYQMPPLLLGGYSPSQTFKWHVDVEESLRRPFARNTCNGCHQSEERPVDGNFHVTPHATGIARLSSFLHNPADPQHDELARREKLMAQKLCASGTSK